MFTDVIGCIAQSFPFGWEDKADGFRGHVFATPDNSTVVLSIKGTSAAFIGGGGPTTKKDKFNDNLLFSCCCARVDWTWTTVCNCYRGGWKCDQDCLEDALVEESLFYPIGTVSSSSQHPTGAAGSGTNRKASISRWLRFVSILFFFVL